MNLENIQACLYHAENHAGKIRKKYNRPCTTDLDTGLYQQLDEDHGMLQYVENNLLSHQRDAMRWMEYAENEAILVQKTFHPDQGASEQGHGSTGGGGGGGGGILADEPGLGKTLTMLSYVMVQKIAHKKRRCTSCESEDRMGHRTLIITPNDSINMHWQQEIQRYFQDVGLTSSVYEGLPRNAQAQEARQFIDAFYQVDITFITIKVLTRDWNYLMAERRGRKNYICPLYQVKWHRICVDEVQEVEGMASMAAKMAKELHSCHRWGISGTPMVRGLHDLLGLAQFLRFQPYADSKWWRANISSHIHGDSVDLQQGALQYLQEMVSQIMWRTSFSVVQKQLQLPQQVILPIRLIPLSAMEFAFYHPKFEEYTRLIRKKLQGYQNNLSMVSDCEINRILSNESINALCKAAVHVLFARGAKLSSVLGKRSNNKKTKGKKRGGKMIASVRENDQQESVMDVEEKQEEEIALDTIDGLSKFLKQECQTKIAAAVNSIISAASLLNDCDGNECYVPTFDWGHADYEKMSTLENAYLFLRRFESSKHYAATLAVHPVTKIIFLYQLYMYCRQNDAVTAISKALDAVPFKGNSAKATFATTTTSRGQRPKPIRHRFYVYREALYAKYSKTSPTACSRWDNHIWRHIFSYLGSDFHTQFQLECKMWLQDLYIDYMLLKKEFQRYSVHGMLAVDAFFETTRKRVIHAETGHATLQTLWHHVKMNDLHAMFLRKQNDPAFQNFLIDFGSIRSTEITMRIGVYEKELFQHLKEQNYASMISKISSSLLVLYRNYYKLIDALGTKTKTSLNFSRKAKKANDKKAQVDSKDAKSIYEVIQDDDMNHLIETRLAEVKSVGSEWSSYQLYQLDDQQEIKFNLDVDLYSATFKDYSKCEHSKRNLNKFKIAGREDRWIRRDMDGSMGHGVELLQKQALCFICRLKNLVDEASDLISLEWGYDTLLVHLLRYLAPDSTAFIATIKQQIHLAKNLLRSEDIYLNRKCSILRELTQAGEALAPATSMRGLEQKLQDSMQSLMESLSYSTYVSTIAELQELQNTMRTTNLTTPPRTQPRRWQCSLCATLLESYFTMDKAKTRVDAATDPTTHPTTGAGTDPATDSDPPSTGVGVLLCAHVLCRTCQTTGVDPKAMHCPVPGCHRELPHRLDATPRVFVPNGVVPRRSEKGPCLRGGFGAKIDAVVADLAQLVNPPELSTTEFKHGTKCLVFSQWTDTLQVLARALEHNQISYLSLGSNSSRQSNSSCSNSSGLKLGGKSSGPTTETKHRAGILEAFRTNAAVSVLLLPLRKNNHGLNLPQATHVFLLEPCLQPALAEQAMARIRRLNQHQKTFVHRYVTQGTVEEPISTLLQSRNEEQSTATTGLPAGLPTGLTRHDVYTVFAPTGGAESSGAHTRGETHPPSAFGLPWA